MRANPAKVAFDAAWRHTLGPLTCHTKWVAAKGRPNARTTPAHLLVKWNDGPHNDVVSGLTDQLGVKVLHRRCLGPEGAAWVALSAASSRPYDPPEAGSGVLRLLSAELIDGARLIPAAGPDEEELVSLMLHRDPLIRPQRLEGPIGGLALVDMAADIHRHRIGLDLQETRAYNLLLRGRRPADAAALVEHAIGLDEREVDTFLGLVAEAPPERARDLVRRVA